jgi:ATP-dependent Zn protease
LPRRSAFGPRAGRHIAIHEAGHAVAALALGQPVRYASIVERGGVGGATASGEQFI